MRNKEQKKKTILNKWRLCEEGIIYNVNIAIANLTLPSFQVFTLDAYTLDAYIVEAKKNYILKMTKKLADSNTSSKSYWTMLNRLLYSKNLPTIPPLLVDGKMVLDFGKKSNILNNFFVSICTPIDNKSCLPSFSYRTGSRIMPF